MPRYSRSGRAVVATLLTIGLTAVTAACSSTDTGGETFTILQYEQADTAQGQGWQRALEIFQERHPDVTVDFQTTSFDAMRQNARITLSGNQTPDVVEFNKGNADGGQLAAQGLLEPLTAEVEARGWDQKVTGGMQSLARYDENGLAGSGDWYGVPNIGEYVTFYYNKDVFADAGISETPTTLAELEQVMGQLQESGHTPVSSSASTSQGFNQMWLWYSLVSAEAERQQIDDFMFLQGDVDFAAEPWKSATDTFVEWTGQGYFGENLAGLNYEQATVNFLSGDSGMLMWNQGIFDRVRNDADFEWGYFTMPGALTMGSSGHLWGVPAEADNKDLAYDWIDITLSPEVQNLIGDKGGLPLAGDSSQISDDLTREYTERFDQLVADDVLSFYPDYPVAGFLDFIQSHMQSIANGNESSDEYLAALQQFYDEGKAASTGS
ncbi:ABC transporter substrate-binding protein [Auraticoccus monumenti]|uniref:Raffinose/stachyose/melibiose transport system substrate-binding protein n=1 Tax=Auraticoccus monumenti TaxID=675864 RepID=A0A1G6UT65_9ACTN|nr:extracellular solute-binding protein [Auraticoccus monumenti]SDD44578.1 raffinose/stachyose/melibiose transport system substrate-binding protein [Auraticoccus monumenti]